MQEKLSVIESCQQGIVEIMDTIGKRITYLRGEVLDMTQEEFARELGVSRGAVGNWELDKAIGRKSIEAISKMWDVSSDWLMNGTGPNPSKDQGKSIHIKDAVDSVIKTESARIRPPEYALGADIVGFDKMTSARLPVRGAVAAGHWLETVPFLDDWEISEWVDGLTTAPELEPYTYCLRVQGTSINKIAPDGACLVCLDRLSGVGVSNGDLVVVERIRDQGTLREVTAKRLIERDRQYFLVPESTDPQWQKEMPLGHEVDQEDGEVRIVAKVKHVILPV